MRKSEKAANRLSVLCCRNCRELYRDDKDGKYRCTKTGGAVLPNLICEDCEYASIAITVIDLLPEVDKSYFEKREKKRKHQSE